VRLEILLVTDRTPSRAGPGGTGARGLLHKKVAVRAWPGRKLKSDGTDSVYMPTPQP